MVNGKEYPLWQKFIDRKDEWIGGTLTDMEDPSDIASTEIVDVELRPNGDSAAFEFIGKDFNCGFDVQYGGLIGEHVENGFMLSRMYGGRFSVQQRKAERP